MLVINATAWVTSQENAQREEQVVVADVEEIEEAVVVTVMVDSAEVARSASSATNLDTSLVNAKKIKISATDATVLDTLRKTANRDLK